MTAWAAVRPRLAGVDAARGLAVLSMYVAHFAPSAGPGRILALSEFLTAPLFAFLIGVGVGVGAPGPRAIAVRVAVLLGLGLALMRTDAQIAIILVHLGVVLVLLALLGRAPSALLAGLGGVLAVVTPVLGGVAAREAIVRLHLDGHAGLARWLGSLAVHGPYRLTELLAVGLLGLLLVRWWRVRRPGVPLLGGGAVVALTAAGALLVLDRLGVVHVRPYTGALATQLLDGALVLGLVGGCLVLGALAERRRSLRVVLVPLAATGTMALSAYVGQVLVAAAWVPAHPTDDSWVLLAGLGLATVVGALAWEAWLGQRARGPVEAVLDRLT